MALCGEELGGLLNTSWELTSYDVFHSILQGRGLWLSLQPTLESSVRTLCGPTVQERSQGKQHSMVWATLCFPSRACHLGVPFTPPSPSPSVSSLWPDLIGIAYYRHPEPMLLSDLQQDQPSPGSHHLPRGPVQQLSNCSACICPFGTHCPPWRGRDPQDTACSGWLLGEGQWPDNARQALHSLVPASPSSLVSHTLPLSLCVGHTGLRSASHTCRAPSCLESKPLHGTFLLSALWVSVHPPDLRTRVVSSGKPSLPSGSLSLVYLSLLVLVTIAVSHLFM